MRLIDEIEAAAAVWEKDSASAADVVESPWWQRLKAALLAGNLMANRIRNDYEPWHPAWAEMESFRAATEGTKCDR